MPDATTLTPPLPSDRAALVDLVARETGASRADIEDMVAAVERGDNESDFFGFTPGVLVALENCAVGYYRGKRYKEALLAFDGLIYLTRGQRSSAWRGAAACHQVTHAYDDAVYCYAQAQLLDPHDYLSAAHCGECLCLLGRRDDGVAMLKVMLERVPEAEAKSAHVVRAKALLAAGGGPGTPSPMALQGALAQARARGSNDAQATDGAQATGATDDPNDPETLFRLAELEADLALGRVGEVQDPDIRRQLADPEIRANLERLADAVADKSLSIRMLADFSDEQMDAGYAAAYLHLERGEVMQSLQIITMMLYVDSRDTRFYQLGGLCAHRLKLYCLADYLYSMVGIWRPGGADPATLIYQGEAKMLSDEVDAGMALVREGMRQGQSDPKMAELIRRGDALLRQGASMGRTATHGGDRP